MGFGKNLESACKGYWNTKSQQLENKVCNLANELQTLDKGSKKYRKVFAQFVKYSNEMETSDFQIG